MYSYIHVQNYTSVCVHTYMYVYVYMHTNSLSHSHANTHVASAMLPDLLCAQRRAEETLRRHIRADMLHCGSVLVHHTCHMPID